MHAIRNALALWYVPEHKCHLDDTPELRQHYIDDWNRRMQLAKPSQFLLFSFLSLVLISHSISYLLQFGYLEIVKRKDHKAIVREKTYFFSKFCTVRAIL